MEEEPCFGSSPCCCLAIVPPPPAATDEWVGQWVFPRENGVPLRGDDGREIAKWNRTAHVCSADGDWLNIRHNVYPGPYNGRVKKSEVVKLDDAVKYFTAKIWANTGDPWP